MGYFVIIVVATALFILLLEKYLAKAFFHFSRVTTKQLNIILDSQSEEELKNERLLKNLKQLIVSLFSIVLKLFLVLAVCALLIWLYFTIAKEDASVFNLTKWNTILPLTIGSLVLLRPKKRKSDYSYWSKLLHYLILDNYNISKSLFKKSSPSTINLDKQPFLVISGLARAGTTALTKKIYASGNFHSLTYGDVPFLLSPHINKTLHKKKKTDLKERSHGDGILFSTNSIEALDEYFFKVFLNDSYILEDRLIPHKVSKEVYTNYMVYQSQIAKNSDSCYITKNNNFMLRYKSFRHFNPKFLFLIIMRNPLDHCYSLMRQHQIQTDLQKKDSFVLDYMNWLGHHEFGKNHKPFDFKNYSHKKNYSAHNINYWLGLWVNYYQEARKVVLDDNTYIITYESIVNRYEKITALLDSKLDIKVKHNLQNKFEPTKYNYDRLSIDDELLNVANQLYNNLATYDLTKA